MRRLPVLVTAAATLALPAVGSAAPAPPTAPHHVRSCGGHDVCSSDTRIGRGAKTCVLSPGADCRGVVDRWHIEHHGNLRKIRFARATIVGADFRP